MQTTRTTLTRLALASAVGLATAAFAQDSTPLLTGPTVESGEQSPTLVRRGFDGEMERNRQQPEVAALDLLDLTEAQREAVDAALAARAATIDGIVRANLATVQKLGEARRSRDRAAAREAVTELRPALEPVIASGPLVDIVAAALPESERSRYTELVNEYREAVRTARREEAGLGRGGPGGPGGPGGFGRGPDPLDDAMGGSFEPDVDAPPAMDEPERPRRERRGPGGERGAQMQSLMMEVQASYARLIADVKSQKGELDAMLDGLDLSPNQRASIEAMLRERREARNLDGDGFEPSREERRELMRAIAEELTPEQRRAFREQLRARRR